MSFIDSSFAYSFLVGATVGAVAGYVGSFMILRRMALVGDALSHVALPGIAVALLFGFNPFLGAFAFLFLAVFGIWAIGERTKIPIEAIVGVFFAASLAAGILLTPELELLEALFGDISSVSLQDVLLALLVSVIVLFVSLRMRRGLLLSIISRDLAESSRFNVKATNLLFLLLVATVVALGVKVVGTLLMGALVIIPAVAARNMAKNFATFSVLSAILGAVSAVAGNIIANVYSFPPGPAIVLSATFLFLISLLFQREKR